MNCHPEKGGSTVVQNIGTNVTVIWYLENYHHLNVFGIVNVSLLPVYEIRNKAQRVRHSYAILYSIELVRKLGS